MASWAAVVFGRPQLTSQPPQPSVESKEISRCRRTADSLYCAERVSLDARDLNEALDWIARQAQRVLNLRQRMWPGQRQVSSVDGGKVLRTPISAACKII